MGVGETGQGKANRYQFHSSYEQILLPPKLDTHPNYYLLYTAPCVQLWLTCSPKSDQA